MRDMMRGMVPIAALVMLAGCGTQSPEAKAIEHNADMMADNMDAAADAIAATADNTSARSSASSSGWRYEEKKDEMRGGTQKLASLESSNTLHLAAPYGDATPALHIRRDPKFGFDIYITSEGQPLCRSYRDDTLSIKFDSGPIKEWRCAESADGSSGVVFFSAGKALLAKIKSSNKMVVEINYYDAGRQQISFDTKGLNW